MATIIPHIHFNGNTEEAETLFNGLSAGGTVVMPLDEGPWGTILGTFRDKFGVEWMVEC